MSSTFLENKSANTEWPNAPRRWLLKLSWLGGFVLLTLVGIGGSVLFTLSESSVAEPVINRVDSGNTNSLIVHPAVQDTADDFERTPLPFIRTYCIRCHSGEEAENGFEMTRFDSQAAALTDLDAWASIIEAVDDQYMPPADEAQPPAEQIEALKQWYLAARQAAGGDAAVVPPMRRLSQIEYENTVDDLLEIDGDLFTNPAHVLLVDDYFEPAKGRMPRYVLALSYASYWPKRPPLLPGLPEVPGDPRVEHGFNNDHSSLSFSPLQAERYFELADAIVNAPTLPRFSGQWSSLFAAPENVNDPELGHNDAAQLKTIAEARLTRFLGRAFRRPAKPVEVDRYLKLFCRELERSAVGESQLSQTAPASLDAASDLLVRSQSFTTAMKSTVSAILASPSLLFRRDFSAGSSDGPVVDAYALASRLSYFLWASMPDEELFRAAAAGELNKREGLLKQVRRMMKDKRIKSLATDFGMQWLKLAKANSVRPDRDLFPEYYRIKTQPPAVSMMIEQLLFFETMMIEDRNIMEFVSADWGYVNRDLMDWYYLDPTKALGYTPDRLDYEDYFRVRWPNTHFGGVITSGAMLISTSATTRTSPVYRGAWILDVVFNRPPPPPPANVPALEDIDETAEGPLNPRDRLSRHRADPNCAVCHDRLDPLGFALEKFDAVGRFRKMYRDGQPIDATGEVFEEVFDGASRFKSVILRNETAFVQGFSEHMLRYALGRRLEIADEATVDQIVETVIAKDKKFSAVVEAIVLSEPFSGSLR